MGSPNVQSAGETTAQQIQALIANLPQLLEAIAGDIDTVDRAQLESARELSPQISQLGGEIAAQEAQARAEAELNIISGTGRELVREATETARIADPEFFKLREQIAGTADTLLSPELTGSELEEVSRLHSQTFGSNTAQAPIKSLQAATQFGSGLRERLQSAAGFLAGIAPSLRSGADTFAISTGRSVVPNASLAGVSGARQTGLQTSQFGSQLLGEAGSTARTTAQARAATPGGFERFTQIAGGIGSLGSAF